MKELIFNNIKSHLLTFTKNHTISMNTEFQRHTDIDSLKTMDMIMDLEDSFDITIPINLVSEIKTVGDLVNIVYNRIHEEQAVMG